MDITASAAYPLPYSEVCDTVRPRAGKTSATRTDLGRQKLIDFLVPRAMLNSLVREHRTESRPGSIEHGLGHPGLGQSRGINVTYRNVVKLPHDTMRELVQEILARVADLGVNLCRERSLLCALCAGKPCLKTAIPARVLNLLARRKRSEISQPQIDTDAPKRLSYRRIPYLDDDVQEPLTATVAAEVRSIFDFAFGERSGIENSERVTCESKCVPRSFNVPPLQRNPSQRLFTPITQVRAPVLRSRLGVLFTYRVYRAGVKAEVFGAPRGQAVEVKPARPTLIPFERMLLSVVAVVPYIVHRVALLIQQTTERLHSVAVNQQHCISIQEGRVV